MQVLLWKDVKNLGERGDLVTVKPGYARNYLVPHGLATLPTAQNLKELEYARRRTAREDAQTRSELLKLAQIIEETACVIPVKSNEEGHLFGSVGAPRIAESLQEQGIQVDHHAIEMETPLKELGVFPVRIRLHAEIEAVFRVWVVDEENPEGQE